MADRVAFDVFLFQWCHFARIWVPITILNVLMPLSTTLHLKGDPVPALLHFVFKFVLS